MIQPGFFRLFLFLVAACIGMFLSSSATLAQCTGPSGVDSQTRYDFAAHRLYVCNGNDWIAIPSGGAGGAGCVLDGVVVPDGQSFSFYNTQSHANCSSVMASRACNDGKRSQFQS